MNRSALAQYVIKEADLNQKLTKEYLKTNIQVYDAVAGGLPRGAVSELFGPPTSGKTSFLHAFIGNATREGEFCALVDASDGFDPASAVAAHTDLQRLLWVRCVNAVQALKAADLLIHSGGWGVVVLDLSDIHPNVVRRLPISYWYRFRLAVENTPTALVVLEREPFVKNCATLTLDFDTANPVWSGAHQDFRLLRAAAIRISPRRPARSQGADFEAKALA